MARGFTSILRESSILAAASDVNGVVLAAPASTPALRRISTAFAEVNCDTIDIVTLHPTQRSDYRRMHV